MRLVAALAVLLGEVEGLGGERERTLGLADADVRLGEASQPERVIGLELHGRRPLDRLLEERQRLAGAPEVRVRRAQRGRDEGPRPGDGLVRLARQTALQDGDGASEVPLGHAHVPEAGAPDDEAEAAGPRPRRSGRASSPIASPSPNSPRSARHSASQAREKTEGNPAM